MLYEFSFHFSIFKKDIQLGIAMLMFSPVTQEAEAVESLWVQDKPGLHIKFQGGQGYVERPCLKKRKAKKIVFSK